MARIRTIKPEFFTSEDIVGMTPLARLFYVSLWCESDREGRLEWKPGTFKMRYLPGDSCDVAELAKELISKGLIVLYSVNGKQYAEIPTFTEHQVINNRESESTIPERDTNASRTRAPRVKAEGKEGREGNGKEGVGRATRLPQSFEPNPEPEAEQGIDRRTELANFRDYWTAKAGKDAAKLDWQATWRTWARKAHRKPADIARQTVPADPAALYTPEPKLTPEELAANAALAKRAMEALGHRKGAH